MGVTSCHDQELAQIVEICVACECLEFFFSFFFLITVSVWVSLPATIKNWPNLHKFVLEVNVWSFFFLLFNKCRCVGVTSCHDQELTQIAEICVAGECLDFFFLFSITVGVWVFKPVYIHLD